MESDRHGVNKKWKIDIYKLALDGSNRADRMTNFDDTPGGYHGSNPVVSPDGRLVVVQLGIHGGGAGQGRGLVAAGTRGVGEVAQALVDNAVRQR